MVKLRILLLAVLICLGPSACDRSDPGAKSTATGVLNPNINEGFEYIKIVPAQPTQVPEGKIEVVEIFWYGCPHCYNAEPAVKQWLARKPAQVVFVRIPAQFGPDWEIHARAFYTAQLLEMEDKLHTPIFDEIHKKHVGLDSKSALKSFFVAHGVDAKRFDEVYDSFAVTNKIKAAKTMVENYGATGVPTMVINGKYRIATSNADGDYYRMMQIVDHLIKLESGAK